MPKLSPIPEGPEQHESLGSVAFESEESEDKDLHGEAGES